MVSDHAPVVAKLVREFCANISESNSSYLVTCLRGKKIRVEVDLISTIIEFPWIAGIISPYSLVVECFVEGQPDDMAIEGTGGFALHHLSDTALLVYSILTNWICPIKSTDPINYP